MITKILTPKTTLFEGEVSEVVLPGDDGEFSILDFHQPCLYRLRSGQVKVRPAKIGGDGKDSEAFLITRGVARVDFSGLTILVEDIEKRSE